MTRLLLLTALLAGCASTDEHGTVARGGAAPTPPAQPMAKPPEPRPCLATFDLGRGRSVLDEQRERGGAARWSDFPTRYRAVYLEPETQSPVKRVEHLQVGQTPLLWFTTDFREAVVNAAVLTDLTLVDGPALHVGERVKIGEITELGQGMLEGRLLLRFLLEADVVRTYWHIGSSVCLLDERVGEAGYHAELSGVHEYYTNEGNHDAFGLVIAVDEAGAITVEGAAAVPFEAKPSAGG